MRARAAHSFLSGRLAVFALASAIAIPVGAQQTPPASTQDTPPATAQSQQTDQSASTQPQQQPSPDVNQQRLQSKSKEGFWGRVQPFARKKWVKRQTDPINDRLTELDRPEEALAVLAEAVADMRPAALEGSSERGCLAVLLTVYSRHLEAVGRIEDAANALGTANDIFRERTLHENGLVVGDVTSERREHSEFLETLERQHEARMAAHPRHHAALLGRLGRQHEAHLASHEADGYDRTRVATS